MASRMLQAPQSASCRRGQRLVLRRHRGRAGRAASRTRALAAGARGPRRDDAVRHRSARERRPAASHRHPSAHRGRTRLRAARLADTARRPHGGDHMSSVLERLDSMEADVLRLRRELADLRAEVRTDEPSVPAVTPVPPATPVPDATPVPPATPVPSPPPETVWPPLPGTVGYAPRVRKPSPFRREALL